MYKLHNFFKIFFIVIYLSKYNEMFTLFNVRFVNVGSVSVVESYEMTSVYKTITLLAIEPWA